MSERLKTKPAPVAPIRPPSPASRIIRPPRISIRAIRLHSRWVAFLKFVLPATALALLALVVAWPTLTDQPKTKIKPEEAGAEIVNPRYLSVDEKSQPYSLTAAKAAQSADKPGFLVLTKPQAEMTDSGGAWVTIDSDLGWYDRTDGVLLMRGNVHVLRDDGSEFTTEEGYSEVRKGTAWGDRHVVGQGPQGEIVAEGFRIADRGKSVVFLNQSKADVQTRNSAAAPSPAKPAATASAAVAPETPATPVVPAVPAVSEAPVPQVAESVPPALAAPAGGVLPRAKPPAPGKEQRINVLDEEAHPAPAKPNASSAKGDNT